MIEQAWKFIIAYSQDKPLLFTHLFFWGFFIAVLIGYSEIYRHNRLRTFYLLAVSFFFYFKTSGIFLVLLVFTICSDYIWGELIYRSKNQLRKKLFLTVSVVLNLSLLCYFKYSYFFVDSINQITHKDYSFFNHFTHFSNTFFGTHFSVSSLLLPVGVSFFTFQSLSYTIDMYRGKVQPVKNILDYGFFVCFFPHLVAGPIVKAHDFLYQIYQPYKLEKKEFGMALFWILNGFGKKIVADYIAVNYIDRIFENPNYYSGVETIFGIFGYSLQIYMDFSGYTDIAIGLALVLGFRLKKNFNSPYKATSTSEFWKRWHISLSSWLQEYLYIPLGGNRKGTIGSYIAIAIIAAFMALLSGKTWFIYSMLGVVAFALIFALIFPRVRQAINTDVNLMVTMLLGGLWHGSSWMFLIWGGLNGLGLIIHKAWKRLNERFRLWGWLLGLLGLHEMKKAFDDEKSLKQDNAFIRFFSILLTLTFISFTRIWFRSDDLETVNTIFYRIQHFMGWEQFFKILVGYRTVFLLMLTGYLIHWIPEKWKASYRDWFAARSYPMMGGITVAVIFLLYQLMGSEMQAFIYFQF